MRGAQTAAEGYDLVTNWVKAMVLADLSRAWCSTMGNEIWLYLHAINFGASRLRQKRQFVPFDQVSPLLVDYCSLFQHMN